MEPHAPLQFLNMTAHTDGFGPLNSTLHAEGVSMAALADAVGTPAYVYSAGTLRARYRTYEEAFAGLDCLIAYAVKANAGLAILKILAVPREIIMPIVFVLCVLGSYSIAQRLFDVWVMLVTGILCFLLRRRGFPVAPFVLGLVLGDIVDKSLRRGLVLSDGSLLPFFTRPISAALAALVLVMLLAQFPAVRRLFSRRPA